jgi:VIT1/CCC1 family predicted Fe2+/Mn2+ transporter
MQRGEVTEHFIYRKLAQSTRDAHNRDVLLRIARDEMGHYATWKKHTGAAVKPSRFKIWLYYLISRIFGLTFGIKLMEYGEEKAQKAYGEIAESLPVAGEIVGDEDRHERELIAMIDEERLHYTADVVRGLNVALVELTGTLAGLTLALGDSQIIILTGLIAGAAMILSVASTEYLGTRASGGTHSPLKALMYGALANAVTVVLLLFPYFILGNVYHALIWTGFNAVVVLLIFSFYTSVARELSFRARFLEMLVVSLGVAGLAFVIGYLARIFLHITH